MSDGTFTLGYPLSSTAPKLVDSRKVYENPWISVSEDRIVHASGKPGIFGVVTMKDGVTVLPITADGEVYLVREYKYGLGDDSIELVSGGLDDGEDPGGAAERELAEELGLTARTWTYLGYVNPFTSVVRSTNHMYLATDLVEGRPDPDATEIIEPLRVPFAQALKMAMEGEITHSASCCLLLKAQRQLAL